jgi:predicted PurR-regulated permease PerM
LERATSNAFSSLPAPGGGWLGGLADNLIWSVVILVSLYYFMRDGRKIVPGLIRLLPGTYQKDAQTLAVELNNIWRIFLRVQIIIFVVLAVLLIASTSLILWLFRQGWLPLSPIGLIILLIIVYAAIQQVDNLWLRPQYMGEALQLHPGVVVVSLLAAFAFTGFLGALLVVPVLASLKFIFQYFHRATSPPQTEPENHHAEPMVEQHTT